MKAVVVFFESVKECKGGCGEMVGEMRKYGKESWKLDWFLKENMFVFLHGIKLASIKKQKVVFFLWSGDKFYWTNPHGEQGFSTCGFLYNTLIWSLTVCTSKKTSFEKLKIQMIQLRLLEKEEVSQHSLNCRKTVNFVLRTKWDWTQRSDVHLWWRLEIQFQLYRRYLNVVFREQTKEQCFLM